MFAIKSLFMYVLLLNTHSYIATKDVTGGGGGVEPQKIVTGGGGGVEPVEGIRIERKRLV